MDAKPSARVLDPSTNMPVVHLEGRAFPGVLIQGDRLESWSRMASTGNADQLEQLRGEITEMLAHYERVLGDHELALPYPKEH